MVGKIKISLYIRVSLLIISCTIIIVTNVYVINHKSNESAVDKTSKDVLTSLNKRRLLSIGDYETREESNFKKSQQYDITTNVNDTLPEDLNYTKATTTTILNFPQNDSEQYDNGSDLVRKNCRIILHVVLSCYCFWMLAIICDEYFIASIHIFCDKLKIKHERAEGTFMVMATSSPELCISCVSAFITDGDIGIGTIVGSSIFNILAVTACCGFFAKSVTKVNVHLLTRDCFFYALSIIGLIAVIYDHLIMWHEAILMVFGYVVYLIIMYSSDSMSMRMSFVAQNIKIQFKKISSASFYAYDKCDDEVTEITPLFVQREFLGNQMYNCKCTEDVKLSAQYDKFDINECATNPWKLPNSSNILVYFMRWPITFILWCSIPECRRHGRFYIVTFISCVAWILALSYLIASMIANVDSISGMMFLGACTSIPDAVSSVIATMKGNVEIGLSNAISANIYDILLCLGLPWCARTLIVPMISGQQWITLNSTGITYSAISLLATLSIFYVLFIINRFKLDRKIGVSCLTIYLIFLIFTLLLELKLLHPINFPTAVVTINGLI